MRICWISFARIGDAGNGLTSPSASARYRIVLPAQVLRARAHEVTVHSLAGDITGVRSLEIGKSNVLVIGKLLGNGWGNYGAPRDVALGLALEAARSGTKIVADLTDDHFDHPAFLDFCRRMAEMGAEFVASSEALARIAAHRLGVDVLVIGDPYEGPHGVPGFPDVPPRSGRWWRGAKDAAMPETRALRFLWFGHPLNVEEIVSCIPPLARFARSRPIELHWLTIPSDSLKTYCRTVNSLAEGELTLSVEPWSPDGLWSALHACDAVLLPSERLPSKKQARSANRLIETLRAGRFAIAHPVPSYMEFRDYAWIGEDLREGIQWALAHPKAVMERISRGQAYIEAQYSPEAIGESWEALMEAAKPPVTAAAEAIAAVRASKPKLHLGCGDKLLDGYVNVDAVSRAGVSPDVVCDIRDLKVFPDDYAEEILAVHVVEHLFRWEVEGLLREWLRVLQPGGRMIIECPNLISACERYIELERDGGDPEREPQRTMWVFYGDPNWKDPLMTHHWGYSPRTLADLMRSIGLVDVRQEPAQFKMKEPRDMRVVGQKPPN